MVHDGLGIHLRVPWIAAQTSIVLERDTSENKCVNARNGSHSSIDEKHADIGGVTMYTINMIGILDNCEASSENVVLLFLWYNDVIIY